MAEENVLFNEGEGNEVPYGISGIEFPITLYDRPQLAASNLALRGDVDAATRAIFAPHTLTPTETRTFRDELTKGRKISPVLKTLIDVTTNPLVWLGLFLHVKYPVGSAKTTHALWEGLAGRVKEVGPLMSYLHSPFVNLRNMPKLWKGLLGFWRSSDDFLAKYGNTLTGLGGSPGVFKPLGRKLSKAEDLMVAAHNMGWHKAAGGKELRKLLEKSGIKLSAGPLSPGLQGVMGKDVIGVAQRSRNWLDSIKLDIGPKLNALKDEMRLKGIHVGGMLEDYFPGLTKLTRYERIGMKSLVKANRTSYSAMIEEQVGAKVAGAVRRRMIGSIPDLDELRALARAGALRPDVVPAVEKYLVNETNKFRNVLLEAFDATKNIADPKKAVNTFAVNVLAKLKANRISLSSRIGKRNRVRVTLQAIGEKLHQLRGTPGALEELNYAAEAIGTPARYSIRATQVLPKYLSQMAPTYAWHLKGWGNNVLAHSKNFTTHWQREFVKDNLIPLMRGLKTWPGFQRAVTFGEMKHRNYMWLKNHPMGQRLAKMSPKSHDFLLKYFGDAAGSASIESIGAQISKNFYLSTLGFNIAAPMKNVMQNYITVMNMPGIGVGGMARGMKELGPKVSKYAGMIGKGVAPDVAFRKAFPDFVKTMGGSEGILRSMLAGDIMKEGKILPSMVTGAWEKTKTAALLPFTTSETFNRLLGFYAAKQSYLADPTKIAALAGRPAMKEALGFARNVVMAAHFPGGPLGMPRAIMNISAPLRQYMHFPLRYAGFLAGSTRWGPDPARMYWGTVGRALAGSTGLYLGAKNIAGVDLSPGLLTGALPAPVYEKAPFHPFPLVPPAVGVAGSIVQAAFAGETAPLESAAALLVPGGVAGRRAIKTLSKKYADYNNRTPDGRIPLYNKDRALIGTFSPMELTLKALGIPTTTAAGEQGAAKWLLSQRDKIREYRREYLQALTENDLPRAEAINRDFQKDYPELGPMQVKKSDIRAIHNRREISRLNRILRGFPKQYRPLFESMVNEAAISRMSEDIEAQPLAAEWYLQQ